MATALTHGATAGLAELALTNTSCSGKRVGFTLLPTVTLSTSSK